MANVIIKEMPQLFFCVSQTEYPYWKPSKAAVTNDKPVHLWIVFQTYGP